MITFEQFATWMSAFITVGSAILFARAYCVARHERKHNQRIGDEQAKEGLLAAEREQVRRAHANWPGGN